MSLAPGTHLGPFEILAPIGAGGMGEVYRAKDTKLKREVALKVLPDSFAGDRDRMARFQREAEMLASLNHRNIAQIYGVEDGALVMELVEGGTLSSPLPIETALNYARQIAEALEYAHERGVIHRDLKPANIKVTPDGTVKLLDFGLAKAIEDPSTFRDDPEHSPTLTLGVTRIGVILGTAAYMSPEQASGKTADRRADIWGFGAVLYEMLSGKRAFAGESVSDTLASVLKLDPDWNALPAETPASIRRLIQRCLTKDRKQRLQAIGEARIAIDESLSGASSETTAPTPAKRSILPWAVTGVLAVALMISLWASWRAPRHVGERLVRLDVDLGSEISLRPPDPSFGTISSVIISPDGTRLVYVASVAGGPLKLFTRRLDQPSATELAGTEGAIFPFFSPDGQWVGFATLNKLNKVSVEGGPVVPLCDIRTFGASWGEGGNIIVDVLRGHGLMLIPSSGGTATPLTELASGDAGHAYPQVLPGGKDVLFTAYRGGPDVDKASIEVASLSNRRRKSLVRGGTYAHYVCGSNGDGFLIYSNKGTLFAIPFDANLRETRGAALPILDGMTYETVTGVAHFDVSRTGTLVYRKASGGAADRVTTVQWLDASGKKEPLLPKPGIYGDLSLSPDGKRLAVDVRVGSNRDIWVYNAERDAMTRLTFGGGIYVGPLWSPNGRYVVFGSGTGGMFWTPADGTGQPRTLTQSKNGNPSSFSPDGKRLAYNEFNSESGTIEIWTVPVEDSGGQLRAGKPEQFLKTQFNNLSPMFSPDGRWLAYESDESGKYEVYVRAFFPDGQGGKWPISNSGGRSPVWSRKNRELIYQSGDQMMAVKYTVKSESFVPEKPLVWAAKLGGVDVADLATDGKRLAVEVPVSTPEPPKPEHEVTLVFNFFDELRRRFPVGK
jgi:serine/threonine protein kinase/Tol biopolymer transport system component